MKRNEVVRKIVAGLLGGLGLFFIGEVIYCFLGLFDEEGFFSHIFFLVCVLIPFVLFGGYCLFVAHKVWLDISVRTVKRISFVAAFFMFFVIAGIIASIFKCETLANRTMWLGLINLFSVLVAGGFYLLFNKLLMRWLDQKEVIDWGRREKTDQRFFFLVAILIWVVCSDVILVLEKGISEGARDWGILWDIVVLFGPIIIAFWVYKICVRIALRNRPMVVDGGVVESG